MAHSTLVPVTPSVLKEEHSRYFTFIQVIMVLIAVTFLELILIILPFKNTLLFSSLIVLSTIKFCAVVWWFMHLRWDRKLCTIIFLIGLTLAGGTVFALIYLFEKAPPMAG